MHVASTRSCGFQSKRDTGRCHNVDGRSEAEGRFDRRSSIPIACHQVTFLRLDHGCGSVVVKGRIQSNGGTENRVFNAQG